MGPIGSFDHSTFTNNTLAAASSRDGGAVWLDTACAVAFDTCSFDSNSAPNGNGGAIATAPESALDPAVVDAAADIFNVTGQVVTTDIILSVARCNFTNMLAGRSGGAIRALGAASVVRAARGATRKNACATENLLRAAVVSSCHAGLS